MSGGLKSTLIILGVLSALLIVSQLAMGLLILNGRDLKTAHQHSGYMTSAVVLVYVGLSLSALLSKPKP